MTKAEQRTAIAEIATRLLEPTPDGDLTWIIEDEGTEDPATSMEIIAANGIGVVITMSISESR